MYFQRLQILAAFAALALAATSGCSSKKTTTVSKPDEVLDRALAPASFAENLRAAGGGHYHATATFRADVPGETGAADKGKEDGKHAGKDDGKLASPPVITTTTDLWVDRQGNFKLSETNDQDGGREVVRVGAEVAVALRYGKMIRRPARDAEDDRFLAEALGAPWAAWDVVRRQVEVESGGKGTSRLKLSDRMLKYPSGFAAAEGLRKWRETVSVKSLDGRVVLDGAGKLPLAFSCKASYTAARDQLPIVGDVAVTATITDIGKVKDVVMFESETPHFRQRMVLEVRVLFGGLGVAEAEQTP